MMDPEQLPERLPLDIPEPPPSHAEANGFIEPTDPGLSTITIEPLPRPPLLQSFAKLPARLRLMVLRQRFVAYRGRWLRVGSAALLLALLATLALVVASARAAVVHYAKLKQGNLTISFGASGALQTATYSASFAGSGVIKEIDVAVGEQVNQGDLIAKLDTTLLQDAYNEAQTDVSNAQTALNDAQNNLQTVQAQTAAQATAAYDAEQAAINSCGSNSACVQRAQDTYANAQAQESHDNAVAQQAFDTAQGALSVAQAKLQTAQDNLNGATLTAPHSGTIAAINGSVGGVAAGLDASTPSAPFVRIADLNALQVQTAIGVNHISGVAKGNAVQISVPVAGAQTFAGVVDSVSPIGVSGGGALTYPVIIDVSPSASSTSRLLPGMKANVVITTQQRVGVTLIPASAVSFASAAADRKHGGFLTQAQTQGALQKARNMLLDLQNSGTDYSQDDPTPSFVLQYVKHQWVAQPVVLGLTDGTSYEVLAIALSVGDSIVSGQSNSSVTIPKPTPTVNS